MAKDIIRGLALFEYANLNSDGTIIPVWRSLGFTNFDDPVTMTEEEATKDVLRYHETDIPADVEYTAGEKSFVFSLLNANKQNLAFLYGGYVEGTGESAVLHIPGQRSPEHVAVRFLPLKGDIYKANHVALWTRQNRDWAKASAHRHEVTGDVLLPDTDTLEPEEQGPDVKSIRGGIATATVVAAGSGYTDGSFTNVRLVNLAGNAALATIVVASGAVTTVTITRAGKNYHVNSALTAPGLEGGSGFEAKVATIS